LLSDTGGLVLKIKLYWPNCDLYYKDIEFNGNDAFFLECTLEEAKEQLFNRLNEKQINQCMSTYDPEPNPKSLEFGVETNKICFLITQDQTLILPEPWIFPYAGQWNAYNPFQKIKEIEIEDIGQLTDLKVDLIED